MSNYEHISIEETEKIGIYRVSSAELIVSIESGQTGWLIHHADGYKEYENRKQSTEQNYSEALKRLKSQFNLVQEII